MSNIIIIGIITYMRPTMLGNALTSLKDIHIPPGCTIEAVVVDNDINGSARTITETMQVKFPFPLHYFIEEKRGIPAARNRAIDEAKKRVATELAFFDDDEEVDKDWLSHLCACHQKKKSITIGPVLPFYPDNAPDWIVKGGFFEPKRYNTGDIVQGAATGNVLYNMAIFNLLRFDERFALTGGTDVLLSAQAIQRGEQVTYCAEAIAYEHVPISRMNSRWLLQRAYRVTLGLTTHKIVLHSYRHAFLTSLPKMVLTAGYGGLLLCRSLVQGKIMRVRAYIYFARAYGIFHGLLRRHYDEYKTIHHSI